MNTGDAVKAWESLVRESVRHTISSYNFATDKGDLGAMALCFTASGSLTIRDDPPLIGRTEIASGLTRTLEEQSGRAGGLRPTTYIHHHVSSTHFEIISDTEVKTRSYFAVITSIGLDHWGRYHDRFAPENEDWLLASRVIYVDGFAHDSLLGGQ
jgi:SnoaL-like domain